MTASEGIRDLPSVTDDGRVGGLNLASMDIWEFKRRATRYANAFDRRYREYVYHLATSTNIDPSDRLEVGQVSRTQEWILRAWSGIAPSRYLLTTLNQELSEAGVMVRMQPKRIKGDGYGRNKFRASIISFDFTKVVRAGQIQPHDFMATLEDPIRHSNSPHASSTQASPEPHISVLAPSSLNPSSREAGSPRFEEMANDSGGRRAGAPKRRSSAEDAEAILKPLMVRRRVLEHWNRRWYSADFSLDFGTVRELLGHLEANPQTLSEMQRVSLLSKDDYRTWMAEQQASFSASP
jgi:hypothetical protein